ncbi:unnamed protein product, partial [Prorocentrum cordatum]
AASSTWSGAAQGRADLEQLINQMHPSLRPAARAHAAETRGTVGADARGRRGGAGAPQQGAAKRASVLAAEFYAKKEQREREAQAVQERRQVLERWELQLRSGEAMSEDQLCCILVEAEMDPRLRMAAALRLARALAAQNAGGRARFLSELEAMILKGSALLLADPTSALELANLMGKELGRPNLEEMICAELEREAMRLPPSRTNPFRYMLVDLAERRTPKPAGERRQMKRTVRQLRLTLELGAVTFQSQGAQQEEENAWAAPGGQPHGDGVGHLRGLQRRESLKLGPPRSPSHGDGASSAGEE